MTVDRRVHMIQEVLFAENRVALAALEIPFEKVDEVHDGRVRCLGDLLENGSHRRERAQRADILVARSHERLFGLGEALQPEERPPALVVQLGEPGVERQRRVERGERLGPCRTPVLPPADLEQLLRARHLFRREAIGMLALERRRASQVGGRRDEDETRFGGAGDGDHAFEACPVVPQDLPLQLVVPLVQVEAGRAVEARGHRLRQQVALPGSVAAGENPELPHAGAHDRPGSGPRQDCREAAHRSGKIPHGGVGSLLEELVVPGVDDEEIRLVRLELRHQPGHTVARVAHPAGVDHLPTTRGVDGGQKCSEPAGEGGLVVIGTAVRRGAAEAEDPEAARRLAPGETLQIEELELGVRGDQRVRGIARVFGHEQRHVAGETDERILTLECRLDAARQ